MPNVSQASLASPQVATYQTARITFVGPIENRYTSITQNTKDQLYLNCILESIKDKQTDQKEYLVRRRPASSVQLIAPIASGENRGIFYSISGLLIVKGNKLINLTLGTSFTLSTSTGPVGFVECTGATPYTFICDGTYGYYSNSSFTVTKVADPDLPSPHIPTPVFIDGYVFLAKSGTADIYNCSFENPTSWSASEFITAEMFPDSVLGLARQNNQLVAFGSESIQFFYDAGNPVGTSPLSVTATTTLQIGLNPNGQSTIAQSEKLCTFVSQSNTGGSSVWVIDGFEASKISTPAIERALSFNNAISAFNIRVHGHFLYVLHIEEADEQRSYVYDYDEKVWTVWQTQGGLFWAGKYATANSSTVWCLPFVGDNFVIVNNDPADQNYKDEWNGSSGYAIRMLIRTGLFDAGNTNRKFMDDAYIICDLPDTVGATCRLRWSDDDGKTWSNWKTLDLSNRPYFKRGGAFRRRIFEIEDTGNYNIRYFAIEITYNQGMH